MRTRFTRLTALSALILLVLSGCAARADTGTLLFTANGEDFVRKGFVSKDGWHIRFENVYVNLAEIRAYQTDPPYDPHEGASIAPDVTVSLAGTFTTDLAEGDENADPIRVGEAADAPAGHYNATGWEMVRASDGPAEGYSLVIVGTADKEGTSVGFTLRIEREYAYTCGEYVGDERKGFLSKDGSAELEMTFHFDHIFGDADTPLDDELNLGALGFAPLAAIARNGVLEVDLSDLEMELAPAEYRMLGEILPTLGHVGEGHCHAENR